MENIISEEIEQYAFKYSKPESELLKEVSDFTIKHTANPQMKSDALVGNFLKMVVQLTKAKRILELGTFTGYSALWMASGMEKGGEIITCDASADHARIAQNFFDQSPYRGKFQIRIGPAMETLETLTGSFDIAFIDADKENYPNYYEKCMSLIRSGGSILIDNTLWNGSVLDPQDPSTKAIHKLNQTIAKDERVDNVLVTIRDGVQWVIKK